MRRKKDYTTGNLLDYLYYQNYYKSIGTDLSKQKIPLFLNKNNFTRKLEEDDVVAMFL